MWPNWFLGNKACGNKDLKWLITERKCFYQCLMWNLTICEPQSVSKGLLTHERYGIENIEKVVPLPVMACTALASCGAWHMGTRAASSVTVRHKQKSDNAWWHSAQHIAPQESRKSHTRMTSSNNSVLDWRILGGPMIGHKLDTDWQARLSLCLYRWFMNRLLLHFR